MATKTKKTTERFIPHVDLLFATLCTSLSVEEATRRLNTVSPSGTSHGWVLADKDELPAIVKQNPWPCDDNPKWQHMFFVC